jgi:site-specific DNA-methyltransferase (adenine-specific)
VKNGRLTTECCHENDLVSFPSKSRDVVVVSTAFDPHAKSKAQLRVDSGLNLSSISLLDEVVRVLKYGGLLFIYGLPRKLSYWGEHLSNLRDGADRMIFKYWIALDIDKTPGNGLLKPAHLGVLMYLKSRADRKGVSPFHLNTEVVRIPHANCAACGRTLKDWGGKKHLMNPKGAALSDVWRDLPRRAIRDSIIPNDVLARITDLTRVKSGSYLHVIQKTSDKAGGLRSTNNRTTRRAGESMPYQDVELNRVLETDCISFLDKVAASHPEGLFDLAFADPPYNLQKLYGNYDDALAEHRYIEWCNQWLHGMARTLKPGGSLFVLNLPKWAIHHAAFLNRHLEFRHWIAWDALSDPRGKIMPAHYALLYYTKPGAEPTFNYLSLGSRSNGNDEAVLPPDSPRYCLRAGCVKERKRAGDDRKVELSDIWFDIHRIKHKRDRDAHPCQLPEKLLERIMLLTTQRGGLVFDPFCGAGTTAIVAAKLGCNFVVTDVDSNYVRITKAKLAAMKHNAKSNGELAVPRDSVRRKQRGAISKRDVEVFLQDLAKELGRLPTVNDVKLRDASIWQNIEKKYATPGAAFKRARVALAT